VLPAWHACMRPADRRWCAPCARCCCLPKVSAPTHRVACGVPPTTESSMLL